MQGYIGFKKTPRSKDRWCHRFHTKGWWRCSSLFSVAVCQDCGIHYEFVPFVDAGYFGRFRQLLSTSTFCSNFSQPTPVCRSCLAWWWTGNGMSLFSNHTSINAGVLEELCPMSFVHESCSESLGQGGDRSGRRILPLCLNILRKRV